MQRLTDQDRAELCRRADLAALMAEDGLELRPTSGHFVGRLRPDERTPSLHVYPPDVGRLGHRGWTFKDYGGDAQGDALGYLTDRRGLPFVDAVRLLAATADWWPEGWAPANGATPPSKPRPPAPPPTTAPRELLGAQSDAVAQLLAELERAEPDALDAGRRWLAEVRRLPADVADAVGPVLLCRNPRALAARLLDDGDDGRACPLTRAGLLAAEGRLPWWDAVALFVCMSRDGSRPYYLQGRRLGWTRNDDAPKYLGQRTAPPAFGRVPYGLPMLREAANRGAEVLLVEGPVDALGARALGRYAVALLGRPQAAGPDDRHGAAVQALDRVRDDLERCRRVLVVPDHDARPEAREEGLTYAARLVGWLRQQGVAADVATLPALGYQGCKDFGDAAAAAGGTHA